MVVNARFVGTLVAGAALAVQPVAAGVHCMPELLIAFAHAGGNGGGNGAGTGHMSAGESTGHENAHAAQGTDGDGFVTATAHTPRATRGQLTAAMGALNAAHAAPAAFAHASPHSQIGKLAAYRSNMLAVLAMPAYTPQQVIVRNNAIAQVRATTLAPATNKSLTPSVVTQVDHLLGLPQSDPTLGVTR